MSDKVSGGLRSAWLNLTSQVRSGSPTKRLAVQGALWTLAGFGASQLLRLVSNLILTRLLVPELFGLMALVHSVLTGLQLFSDIGLNTSVIRHKRGDESSFLNTVWTLQIFRGAVLWLGSAIVAYPIAQLYDEPRLLWLLPVIGLSAFTGGFNSTALATLGRHLAVRQLTILELTTQVISLFVMIGWAYLDPSVWALVAGAMTASFLSLFWSHRLNSGPRNRFAWERGAVAEIISFGTWIFVSTAMTFLASQADRLLLGKLFSLEFLGIYIIAFSLADMPRAVVAAISARVIFPSFSMFVNLPRDEFRDKIQRNRGPLLAAIAVGLALVAGFGDYAVRILYDARYAEASWMVPLLAVGLWPVMLTQTIDAALFAIGKPRVIAQACLLSFLTLAIGILLGGLWLGPVAAVMGVAAKNVPFYIVTTHGLWRERLACLGQDLRTTALFVACCAVVYALRSAFGLGLPLPGL